MTSATWRIFLPAKANRNENILGYVDIKSFMALIIEYVLNSTNIEGCHVRWGACCDSWMDEQADTWAPARAGSPPGKQVRQGVGGERLGYGEGGDLDPISDVTLQQVDYQAKWHLTHTRINKRNYIESNLVDFSSNLTICGPLQNTARYSCYDSAVVNQKSVYIATIHVKGVSLLFIILDGLGTILLCDIDACTH